MNQLSAEKKKFLHEGTVIPAHPLALNANRQLDEEKQRRLTRYYMAAGAGGVAVGVHTTQFEIREPQYNLLEPVFRLAAEEIAAANLDRPFIKIAGICGKTEQALAETDLALQYGYDMGLVSMAALSDLTEMEVIEHIKKIASKIPVFGFYLQTTIGGRAFSYDFWKEFAETPNVQAIKVASFNRYQTIDVVRAVCNSSRKDQIALYTGNDDNIVNDLLTPYQFKINGEIVEKRFVGGLLGHWAAWTQKAVGLLTEIKAHIDAGYSQSDQLFTRNIEVTDMNAAIFDPSHQFHGCIAGIHQVLYQQGLLDGIWCLNEEESLSEGQLEEIQRVIDNYPHLIDDEFVKSLLEDESLAASH